MGSEVCAFTADKFPEDRFIFPSASPEPRISPKVQNRLLTPNAVRLRACLSPEVCYVVTALGLPRKDEFLTATRPANELGRL